MNYTKHETMNDTKHEAFLRDARRQAYAELSHWLSMSLVMISLLAVYVLGDWQLATVCLMWGWLLLAFSRSFMIALLNSKLKQLSEERNQVADINCEKAQAK